MTDEMKKTIIIMAGVISAVLIIVLYQGIVVQPSEATQIEKAKIELSEKIRQEGIDYANQQDDKLAFCLIDADADYWRWIELNMTKKDDGSYWGSNYNWDKAETNKKTAQNECYRQFSNE